jgi:phosphoglycerate dehydrogenase-like enzyme
MTADRLPRAAVPARAVQIIRDRNPNGVEIEVIEDGADLRSVDFLVPGFRGAGVLDRLSSLTQLSVLQVLSAGTDHYEDVVPPKATLCSARGARDGPVAEWILGALLGASSGLLQCARERQWDDERHNDDLGAWTVLIVGLGSIGRLVEDRLQALGTTVVGVASHARDGVHGIDELLELLPQADAVVLLTPLTDRTHGLIGAAELAAMPDGGLLVNAARGPVVDTDALLAEVVGPRLRAVLDVTDPEPLPAGHPLWDALGVLSITPHVGGDSPLGWQRAAELAGDQLARWLAGEELLNVVRKGTA